MPADLESMAFFGEVPWHKQGTALTEADLYDWPSACKKAGLEWEVELAPLCVVDTQTPVEHKAVRRKSDQKVLGVVGPRFVPLQNKDAFKWFEPFLLAKEAALHTAGSLRGGQRIWVLAQLSRDPVEIVKGDEVRKFLLLSHGHDGSLAVRVGFTPIRVVCANTLAMAHSDDASKLIHVRHTAALKSNLEAIRDVMNIANQRFEATATQYRRLAHKSINRKDVEKYVAKVLGHKEDEEMSTRMRNIVERIVGLTETGRGNNLPGVRGTLWSAYNGVTQWLSYERSNSDDNRLNALWYGDGASLNQQALDVALSMCT